MPTFAEPLTLDAIIDNRAIDSYFQPIVNIFSGQIYGYEALSRGPQNSPLHMPYQLFSAAEQQAKLPQLESLCRQLSLHNFQQRQLPGKLFINMSPKVLLGQDYPKEQTLQLIRQLGLKPSQIVIELSEQHASDDIAQLKQSLDYFRDQGVAIALDDLGTGYSGLQLWSELLPEYVKIDRHFIEQIDNSRTKQVFVRTITELCRNLTCTVIAEGIETEAELETLRRLGISLCQGFLLGRPNANPSAAQQYRPPLPPPQHLQQHETAASLCESYETRPPTTSLKALSEHFMQYPKLQAVAIVAQGKALGLVYRQNLLEIFSTPFGRAFHENHPIVEIMNTDVLMVDVNEPLSNVSYQLTLDDNRYVAQLFIILKHGKFHGVGRTRDLLQRLTEQRLQNARHANPLTELPGNVPIQQELQRLAKSNAPFYLAYLDLNFFKPYNDIYGFAKGDYVIRITADLVRPLNSEHFVGHIGGDDFVVISTHDSVLQQCQRIIAEFERIKRHFFEAEHWQAGQLEAKNREGNTGQFPLISLSIGVLPPALTQGCTEDQLSTLSAMAKKQAKQLPHGFYVLNRHEAEVA